MSPSETSELHHFTRWEHEPTSLSLGCKRLRPLVPKLITVPCFDLKSFIRPETGPTTLVSSDYQKKESHHVEAQSGAGGTRWNPTQEQIGILEMLYKSGMRTPNAPQIEQITAQLAKYGKIEGKNVFYWFQNHKARERQKQKRNLRTPTSPLTTSLQLSPASGVEEELSDSSPYKRKRKPWGFDQQCVEDNKECRSNEEEVESRTLKLFPLHPEGRCRIN